MTEQDQPPVLDASATPKPVRTSFVKAQIESSIMTLRGLNVIMSMMTAPKFEDPEAERAYFSALAEDIRGWRNDLALLGKELGAMLAVADDEIDRMVEDGKSTDVVVPAEGAATITGNEKEFGA